MKRSIIAICLSIIIIFNLTGCSVITRKILNTTQKENDHTGGNFAGWSDGEIDQDGSISNRIEYYVDEDGKVHVIVGDDKEPDDDNNSSDNSNSNSDAPISLTSLCYFSPGNTINGTTRHGRFGEFEFKKDGTFNLCVMTYALESYDGSTWYCPGGETSGEDTPRWTGTYKWNNTTLTLTFKYKLVTNYDCAEDGSPIYLGETKNPFNKTITLELESQDKNGAYFNVGNLPLYSGFDGGLSGKTYMFFKESYINTLYPNK